MGRQAGQDAFGAGARLDAEPALAPPRYGWVDVLRGLAAVIVLVSHVSIFGLYGYEHTLATYLPTRLLWAGHQAVILFFVVSGFSLYLLMQGMVAQGRGWLTFIAVRILRLYPPYAVSLLLALVVVNAPHWFGIALSDAAPVVAHGRTPPGELLGHFMMVGSFDTTALNPPIWSLVQEMRLSLLFPLLYLLVQRWTWRPPVVWIIAFLTVAGIIAACEAAGLLASRALQSLLGTLEYTMMFLAGAYVARRRADVQRWMAARSVTAQVSVLALALMMFMYGYGYDWPGWAPGWAQSIADMVTTIASLFFVALAISQRRPVRSAVLRFLGHISYSLYLVHQVVIMAVILLCFGRYPVPVLWGVSIALSLLGAWLFFIAVEAPSMAVSRRARARPSQAAARAMSPRIEVAAHTNSSAPSVEVAPAESSA